MNRRRMMMESKIKLNYLEAIDGAYIDTEYIPTDNTAFEFEAAFDTNAQVYYGSINQISEKVYERFHAGVTGGTMLETFYDSNFAISKSNDGKYHIYYLSKTLVKLDDIEHFGSMTIPQLSLYIMSRNSVNVYTKFVYTMNRCHYAKIYENGQLVRHFVPSFNNGLYCMYEIVQGKYYYNASETGSFTGGVD